MSRPTDDIQVILDMDLVARRALGVRRWWLEFDCDGAPFTCQVDCADENAAEDCARGQLQQLPGFNAATARLVACLER